ncbi:sensor histidine kinase [Pseudomarimonas arenosa]|uniref:histidine kinase n=1 Tax=Pseudomarimonas arenosa TaxID=2774145 RepID=A0AAW3ZNU8_9GAMM|nr:HAMP domain-containing sensor histidine kinase [Pseudomarimonas arenosa]MBD8527180.1 HAMP domain-containing histidine kinase [Pseudomarimonas arenosa]
MSEPEQGGAEVASEGASALQASLANLAHVLGGGCGSLQLWVDDDLGLHPRAVQGEPGTVADRRMARQCCLLSSVQVEANRAAVPLRLSDRRVGAVLVQFASAPTSSQVQHLQAWVEARLDALDTWLVDERLTRLSGVARRAEALRVALAAAHDLEQVASLSQGFAALHRALGPLLVAENFFVVLLDERREWLHFPYHCDQYDHNWEPISFRQGRLQGSMSAIIVAAGRVLRGSSEELLEQAGHGDTKDDHLYGPNASDWLGVPMVLGAEVSGAMVVQSYQPGFRFGEDDPAVLTMLAEASAAALYRRRVRETLERMVAERTAELQQARDAAEHTLSQLRAMQKQLVMSEKMASLGQLVAGVAHEVNTPLGVALTAASLLDGQTVALERSFSDGRLTRSEMQRFVNVARDATGMVLRNLERAGRLVHSFKQVSVDQTVDARRRFDLSGFLQELLESSKSMWKGRSVEVSVQCSPGIELDSFPGTLGQVLINLIQNALTHAFAAQAAGEIGLSANTLADDQVEIRVRDNGVGVPEELRDKIFEPFFTTRRNQGGTGLGLHIVFNLVTQTLGGSIELVQGSAGTDFRLCLPRKAPGGVATSDPAQSKQA